MNSDQLIEDLNDALAATLRALARLGVARGDCEAPVGALDEALGEDSAYQDARAAFKEAMGSGTVPDVEAAHNHAIATAAEVGWLLATSAFNQKEKETR